MEHETQPRSDSLSGTGGTAGGGQSRGSQTGTRGKLKQILRWIILLIVVVGLALTGRDSYRKWNQQQQDIQTEIDALAKDIEAAAESLERQRLVTRRDQLIASKPSLAKIRWAWLGNLESTGWMRIWRACSPLQGVDFKANLQPYNWQ